MDNDDKLWVIGIPLALAFVIPFMVMDSLTKLSITDTIIGVSIFVGGVLVVVLLAWMAADADEAINPEKIRKMQERKKEVSG